MRDMQYKSDYTKQRFLKSEKQFLSKREKVLAQMGNENSAKVSQVMIDSMLPTETQDLKKSTELMNYYTNQVL
jgi:hypothetical protein